MLGPQPIDGRLVPPGVAPDTTGQLDFMDRWYPIQVKQKDQVGRPDIDAFETAIRRANRDKGFYVGFDFSEDARHEISRFFKKEGRVIVALTVQEILEEQIAIKLV